MSSVTAREKRTVSCEMTAEGGHSSSAIHAHERRREQLYECDLKTDKTESRVKQ